MIRYGSTAHWFAKRFLYSLCVAVLAGVAMSVVKTTAHWHGDQHTVTVCTVTACTP